MSHEPGRSPDDSAPVIGARTPTIALLAGEDSGDQLGAELASALAHMMPGVRLVGVCGPRMRAAGVDSWHDIAELSVMGIAEVLGQLPRLLRLRREIGDRLLSEQPDVVVGIDAPDFNLGLERRLKRAGLATAHYVSPSIWAWRAGRARSIGQSADLVLCLFPMEPPLYARHGVSARFVGHPLAENFALDDCRDAARTALGLAGDRPVLAILPGSRGGELKRLLAVFLDAAEQIAKAVPGIQLVIPAANPAARRTIQSALDSRALEVLLLDGQAHDALRACDVALLASGTAALEAMLAHRAMVVGYRIAPLTHALVHGLRLMKVSRYSLPNVLAGRELVPELMQERCTAPLLAEAALGLLQDRERRLAIETSCRELHRKLRGEANASAATEAARAIAGLIPPRDVSGSQANAG